MKEPAHITKMNRRHQMIQRRYLHRSLWSFCSWVHWLHFVVAYINPIYESKQGFNPGLCLPWPKLLHCLTVATLLNHSVLCCVLYWHCTAESLQCGVVLHCRISVVWCGVTLQNLCSVVWCGVVLQNLCRVVWCCTAESLQCCVLHWHCTAESLQWSFWQWALPSTGNNE